MNEKDKLLVMTACELLGKSVTPNEVEMVFERIKKRLELSRLPPREAKVTYGPRHE
jgi:hypothetical protein